MKEKKVIAAIRNHGEEGESIEIFDSYDELYGLYDHTEEFFISEKTYEKLCTGDWFAKRYGSTLRAYQN